MTSQAEARAEARQEAQRRRKGKGKGRPQGQQLLAEDLQPRRQNGFDSFYPWWPAEDSIDHVADVFLTDKVGPNEEAILPDTGAHDNLCGDAWAMRFAGYAKAAGERSGDPSRYPCNQHELTDTKTVQGVGKGSQTATWSVDMTMATNDVDGVRYLHRYEAPCLDNSNVPGLMGIKHLKREDALIRCSTGEMWFLGAGGVELQCSPGTKHFQMKEARGGHLGLASDRLHRRIKQGIIIQEGDPLDHKIVIDTALGKTTGRHSSIAICGRAHLGRNRAKTKK